MLRYVIATVIISVSLADKQAIAVRGKLLCDSKPASGVLLKLYEKDVLWDTKLGKMTTGPDGTFELSGSDSELSSIDPSLNIYHDCNDSIFGVPKPCQRRITFKIPSKYISTGTVAREVYDLGTIQLSGKFPGETRDCLHRH